MQKSTASAHTLNALAKATFMVLSASVSPGLFAQSQVIPNTGQLLTPLAPRGARFESLNPHLPDFPNFTAGGAVQTVVSPDKKTLLVLTSGYNRNNTGSGKRVVGASNEYVFVYDISKNTPVQTQVLQVPNTYNGIVFDPSGTAFYVPGGVHDNVHFFSLLSGGSWSETGTPLPLGHQTGVGNAVAPEAAGIDITKDGSQIVVANYYNDSISLLTKSATGWSKSAELDLRPGKNSASQLGVAGGEYPLWVSIKGTKTAYVSSIRDREVVAVDISAQPKVVARIKVAGQPQKMTLNATQTTLYVAEDQTDSVAVIDTVSNSLVREASVAAPAGLLSPQLAQLSGNNTNNVTLGPGETTLWVTNGNTNNVAVLDTVSMQVQGLIPTGWYPNSVSFSGTGRYAYVVNGKSPTGPNAGYCRGSDTIEPTTCAGSNQYDLQLLKAGLQYFRVPTDLTQFSALTQQVAANNNYQRTESQADQSVMAFLRSTIQHVIYIIKENRTYDQVLGDLAVGNGDPALTEFGSTITPNLHSLASKFVTLDNFYDSSEVSFDGWPYSTSARAPDVVERQVQPNYAGRGMTNDSEGDNRNVNTGLANTSARLVANPLTTNDPDLFPGAFSVEAPDGPNNALNTGYLWDGAIRAGLTVRNYGFHIDLSRYFLAATDPNYIPLDTTPFANNRQVAYSANAALSPLTDPYFRGYDNSYPDYYRYTEWARDFDANYANGGLPALTLMRLHHDHTGNFATAISGLTTPEAQVADNDYAVGLVVQKIAGSQYKGNTLIFVIEDDAQDGGDHVDAHRSIAFIVGPYVKQGAVVSTPYNTINFVRTIEDVLGIAPLNLNDGVAVPMTDVFDSTVTNWSYTATASSVLAGKLPVPQSARLTPLKPTHSGAYWARVTKGLDFTKEDLVDGEEYNHILWKGLMGNRPYPETPSGLDLRENRAQLLSNYNRAKKRKTETRQEY
jgi:YVTN family beta-propeller protein